MDWKEQYALHREGGQTWAVGRPCLAMELYGENLSSHAGPLLDRFLEQLPEKTPLYAISGNGRSYGKVGPQKLAKFRNTDGWFAMTSEPEFRPGEFSCERYLGSDHPLAHDSLFLALPLAWGEAPGVARSVALLEGLLRDFPFWGAMAGWGFDIVWGREFEQSAMPVNFRLSQRYWGLLVRDRLMSNELLEYAGEERPPMKRLFSPAWLTYLGADLLTELGGRESFQAQLGPQIAASEIRDGVLLRTSETPPIAEVGRFDEDSRVLARLGRLLEPVIRKEWFFSANLLGVDRATATKWLHRFGS